MEQETDEKIVFVWYNEECKRQMNYFDTVGLQFYAVLKIPKAEIVEIQEATFERVDTLLPKYI